MRERLNLHHEPHDHISDRFHPVFVSVLDQMQPDVRPIASDSLRRMMNRYATTGSLRSKRTGSRHSDDHTSLFKDALLKIGETQSVRFSLKQVACINDGLLLDPRVIDSLIQ